MTAAHLFMLMRDISLHSIESRIDSAVFTDEFESRLMAGRSEGYAGLDDLAGLEVGSDNHRHSRVILVGKAAACQGHLSPITKVPPGADNAATAVCRDTMLLTGSAFVISYIIVRNR
ncbi:MAG: hypothetical protein R2744_05650 [Bacteroidales bacterium]